MVGLSVPFHGQLWQANQPLPTLMGLMYLCMMLWPRSPHHHQPVHNWHRQQAQILVLSGRCCLSKWRQMMTPHLAETPDPAAVLAQQVTVQHPQD